MIVALIISCLCIGSVLGAYIATHFWKRQFYRMNNAAWNAAVEAGLVYNSQKLREKMLFDILKDHGIDIPNQEKETP